MAQLEEQQWYFHLDGQNFGPFTFSDFQKNFEIRALAHSTMVWRHGMETWAQADSVPEAQVLFQVPLPPDPSQMTIPLQVDAPSEPETKTLENEPIVEPAYLKAEEVKTQSLNQISSTGLVEFSFEGSPEQAEATHEAFDIESTAALPERPSNYAQEQEPSPSLPRVKRVNEIEVKPEPILPSPVSSPASSSSGSVQKKFSSVQAHSDESQRSNEDMSMLTELRPDEVDDKTEAIDRRTLRVASQEAKKARDVGAKAKKRFISGGMDQSYIALGLGLVSVVGLSYVGYLTRASWMTTLMPSASDWVERVFSPLPTLEEVTPENYRILKAASQKSLSKAGPSIAVVLSKTSDTKPVLIVGTNLPEGTHLNLFVHSIPGTVLSEKQVDITTPLLVSQLIAKSPSLHAGEGDLLPMGEYEIVIVDDPEQTPPVKTALSLINNYGGAYPPYIPTTSVGRKVVGGLKMFLGGVKDENYTAKLVLLQRQLKDRAIAAFQALETWCEQEELSVSALKASMMKASKASGLNRKRNWSEFEKTWILPQTLVTTDPSVASHQVTAKALHDSLSVLYPQIQKAFGDERTGSNELSLLTGQIDLIEQKIGELKKALLELKPH